jgi:hypothetical protein
MNAIPSVFEITSLHARLTMIWHEVAPSVSGDGFPLLVEENHLRNFSLWHEEDVARRDDLGAESVRNSKRAIDRYNQERNDFVEKMDKALVEALRPMTENVPFNSETPGMMIDRLSILALKEFHMKEQAGRADVDASHREKCAFKLGVIKQQIVDLAGALDALLKETREGSRSFRVYFQFKMYNDPSLNPQLYGKK